MKHPRTRELLEYLDAQRAELRAAFESVPTLQRDRVPAGGWSAAGIIEHLAIVEKRISSRLTVLIAEASVAGLGAEPSSEPLLSSLDVGRVADRKSRAAAPEATHPTGLSADAAWAALEEAGKQVRGVLHANDGLALGTLSMPHPLFGPWSAWHWLAFVGAHEARHAAQIRGIIDAG
jgi:hypothetical protein